MPTADPTTRVVDAADLVPLVDPDTVIESGGNATLTRCRYRGDEVLYKEFRPEYLAEVDEPALRALVTWRWDLPAATRDRLDELAAWPRNLVRGGDGAVCGLLMPVAAHRFFRPRHTGERTPRTFYDLLASRRSAAAPLPQKLTACAHLVRAVLWLHDLGVVVDDLQPDNVLCATTGGVYLVDCDSMVSPGGWGQVARPVAPHIMSDVVAPGTAPAPDTDLVKLTWVLLWVLLDRFGLVRVGGDEHARLRAEISPETADLLFGALTTRPAPEVWRRAADGWLELASGLGSPPTGPPTGPPAQARPDGPAPAAARTPWLPTDLAYRPAPAPVLFPPRYGRRSGRRMRPGLAAALMTVLVVVVGVLIMAVEGWPL
jgi:hypothetical protein